MKLTVTNLSTSTGWIDSVSTPRGNETPLKEWMVLLKPSL